MDPGSNKDEDGIIPEVSEEMQPGLVPSTASTHTASHPSHAQSQVKLSTKQHHRKKSSLPNEKIEELIQQATEDRHNAREEQPPVASPREQGSTSPRAKSSVRLATKSTHHRRKSSVPAEVIEAMIAQHQDAGETGAAVRKKSVRKGGPENGDGPPSDGDDDGARMVRIPTESELENARYGDGGPKQSVIQRMKREEADTRLCFINNHPMNDSLGYVKNTVKTTKYTWWNFLPKSLLEQFRRVFTVYYLVVVIIGFIPGVSPVAPAVNLIPLVVILGFGIAREFYEDVKRSIGDRRLNNSLYDILPRDPTSVNASEPFVKQKCASLEVGDIVFLRKGDLIPADLLVLSCSDASGLCYVSTANLDGETNLKLLRVVSAETNSARKPEQVAALRGLLSAQQPDPALYHFEAQFSIEKDGKGGLPIPVDSMNLALRGSRLRNTAFMYGAVVYAGYDTKEALNMRIPPYKFGELEKMLNWIVIFLAVSLFVICVAYGSAATIVQGGLRGYWYLGQDTVQGVSLGNQVDAKLWFESFAGFLILYAAYVPVSLFVTLELCRVAQTLFMQYDREMESRGRNAASTASNLNETLAEIDYICTDKTGTLTENLMKFVSCSVDNDIVDIRDRPDALNISKESSDSIRLFVLSLALCHNVVPEPPDDEDEAIPDDAAGLNISAGDGKPKLIEYQGPSPDEVALVDAARSFGMEVLARPQDSVLVKIDSEEKEYKILAELEFNSDRKRMSVILRDPDDNKLYIYTKGADNIMLGLVKKDGPEEQRIAVANEHVDFFAKEGLRTLIYARKELSEEECASWMLRFNEAKSSLEDRANRVDAIQAEIEQNLTFVGISAVEDRLQADLPATIEFLRLAGIKIWVLTGDKRQTAESIGYSSALLDSKMRVLHIEAKDSDDAKATVENLLLDVAGSQFESMMDKYSDREANFCVRAWRNFLGIMFWKRELRKRLEKERQGNRNNAVIVDGKSLQFLIDNHADSFMDLCDFCKTVICCRVTPMQKALVVRMVQSLRKKITLAIGDGANDVSMIQEAQIGVGIYGKEGMNAARAADYSFSEFRFLRRLLMIHGHYAYVRTAKMINLQFYKNLLFVCAQFFFQYACLFSGASFHNQWYVSTFNVVITSIPPFVIGCLERDLRASTLYNIPELYRAYQLNPIVGIVSVFEYTVGYGLYHAIIIYVFGVYTFESETPFANDGRVGGRELQAFMVTSLTCFVTLVKMMMVTRWWNWIFLLSIAVSLMFFYLVPPVFINVFDEAPLIGILQECMASPVFWLYLLLCMTVSLFPDFIMYMYRKVFSRPDPVQICEEIELKGVRCLMHDFE